MTADQFLNELGLPADPSSRAVLREALISQIALNKSGQAVDADLMRALCLQLFSLANVEDTLLIWQAKTADFDMMCGIDVQFLCGAGLDATKQYLQVQSTSNIAAIEALKYLCDCQGDFVGWTPQSTLAQWQQYFGRS